MNKVLAVLLLAALSLGATAKDRVQVGQVVKVTKDHLDLNRGRDLVSIGFVLDANAVSSLGKIQIGQEVRAVFGDTADSNGHLINRLLSIRPCTPNDKECAADRARQEIEQEEEAQRNAAINLQHYRCRQAMNASLANDPRYAPEVPLSAPEETRSRFNALSGERKACASEVLRQHKNAVIEACELHHCGDKVGGGCSHIAGYSMTDAAIERAVAKCAK